MHGSYKECIQGFCGKARKKKIPVGRPTHRWKDNIIMDLRKIRWGCISWIDLA
jgi:hypothetical protein